MHPRSVSLSEQCNPETHPGEEKIRTAAIAKSIKPVEDESVQTENIGRKEETWARAGSGE